MHSRWTTICDPFFGGKCDSEIYKKNESSVWCEPHDTEESMGINETVSDLSMSCGKNSVEEWRNDQPIGLYLNGIHEEKRKWPNLASQRIRKIKLLSTRRKRRS